MKPYEGASSSRVTLRSLAGSIVEQMSCDCSDHFDEDDTDVGTAHCPCAGDECWSCAAKMALANADEAPPASGALGPVKGTQGDEKKTNDR